MQIESKRAKYSLPQILAAYIVTTGVQKLTSFNRNVIGTLTGLTPYPSRVTELRSKREIFAERYVAEK